MPYDFLRLPGEQMVPRAASAPGTAAPGQGKVSWVVIALIIAGLAVAYYLFKQSEAPPPIETTPAQGDASWQAAAL